MVDRTYDWNGRAGVPISFPHLTDQQMAGTVRMLMRHDLGHEGIVCGARDRIMCLVKEKAALEARVADLIAERDNLATIVTGGIDEVAGAALDDAEETIQRLTANPAPSPKVTGYRAEPDFAASIKRTCSEEASNGAACGWTPCTGCYDTEDGHPTANYPHSRIFGCDVGSGCSECGGLGVVFQYWSPEDLEDMQRDCVSETKTAPAPQMEA